MKFPSEEWAAAYQRDLNASPEYRAAARGWAGDLVLRVTPPDPSSPAPGIYLDLAEDGCRQAKYMADSRSAESEFVFEAPSAVWAKLFRREIDAMRAVLDGTVKIRGNMAKLLRFTRAAKVLVETAAAIATDG